MTGDIFGCGFVVGERHIMTCAHVVAEALGLPEQCERPTEPLPVRFIFAEPPAHAQALVVEWRPRRPPGVVGEGPDDIAVLELCQGYDLPDDVSPAPVSADVRPGVVVDAAGYSAKNPQGEAIDGTVGARVEGPRWTIVPSSPDRRVLPGSSGAALWSRDAGGVIGMIAERQQQETGLFIGARTLLRAWPRLRQARVDNSREGERQERAREPLSPRLARHLYACDRQETGQGFATALKDSFHRRRTATLCLAPGLDSDLPEKFGDRCRVNLLARERGEPAYEVAERLSRWEAERLVWPERGLGRARALDVLRTGLAGYLARSDEADSFGLDGLEDPGSVDSQPEALRLALNRRGRWRLFYTELEAEDLDEAGLALLKDWSGFLGRIGRGGLDVALIHLICLRLPVPPESLSDDPEAWAAAAADRLLAGLGTHGPQRLPALSRLKKSDVELWLERTAQALGVADRAYDLQAEARSSLNLDAQPRLGALERWIDTLKLQDTP